MNEEVFYQAVSEKAGEFHLNPMLLISGIEGIYSFKDVKLNAINYGLLDSLILTIFALRIGDTFHRLAEGNLQSSNLKSSLNAEFELRELSTDDIHRSGNTYLQSFAQVLHGKSAVRQYHVKALEVAALEIRKVQLAFQNDSIGIIMLAVCKDDPQNKLGLGQLFN